MAKEEGQDSGFYISSERAIDWLAEQWGEYPPCAYCGNKEWGVMSPGRFLTDEGKTEPLYRVVCRGCGNTVLVDSRFVRELPRDSTSK